ncbi:hypothetical protein FJY94_02625 [Candidatus Kaiserbacteria bacterium]|nr:hypothetical protein [Candidatus Kaiserbacteria bacterium]
MDTTKDTSKKDVVAKFVGNQTSRTSPFGDNVSADRAYRKAEKIAAALHLLTAHVSDTESAKAEVRRAATAMLLQVLSMRDELRSADSPRMRECTATIRYLISMVRMLCVSGHVSIQNADITTEALDDLGVFLSAAHKSVLSESVRLTREEFIDVRMKVETMQPVTDIKKDTIPTEGNSDRGDVSLSAGNAIPSPASDTDAGGSIRSQGILEVLRSGGQWGIKDIAAHFPEYSEKMIQRELAYLVHAGVVSKIGEKRWSRYAVQAISKTP